MKSGLVLTLLAASCLPSVARESIAPGHFATKLGMESSKKADDPSISKKTQSLVGDLLSAASKEKDEPSAAKQAVAQLGADHHAVALKAAAEKAAAEKAAAEKEAAEKAAAQKAAAERAAAQKAEAEKPCEDTNDGCEFWAK